MSEKLFIAITRPDDIPPRIEAREIIAALADRGFDRVHIRKPQAGRAAELLKLIPRYLHRCISVHNADSRLVEQFPDVGVHLTGSTPVAPEGFEGMLSCSCHSIEEIRNLDNRFSYAFLSPVFDSVSKPGYKGGFSREELKEASQQGLLRRCVALGGLDESKIESIAELGFAGYAMLGNAWPRREQMSLQFISHCNDRFGCYESGIQAALDGGCRWIQLRMKDASTKERIDVARRVAPMCHSVGAILIIDDDVEAVTKTDADGVHLGKNDMPLIEARAMLTNKIIGATANSADDLIAAFRSGADYAGLGPYRWTETKKRLSPILGIEGYRSVFSALRKESIEIPTVAIGGVKVEDIAGLIEAGAAGIAVSGSILNADDASAETARLIAEIGNSQRLK